MYKHNPLKDMMTSFSLATILWMISKLISTITVACLDMWTVATRIVQRWRKPSNPISDTVGSISDKIDFLISAPYADKLPLKVAELIRKDVPFAVLLPLSLLNEIENKNW
jgi:hypothetical protein